MVQVVATASGFDVEGPKFESHRKRDFLLFLLFLLFLPQKLTVRRVSTTFGDLDF